MRFYARYFSDEISITRSQGIILDALSDCIPFFKKEKVVQINYVTNLIKVTEYCASAESHILKIIFGRYTKNHYIIILNIFQQISTI